MVDFKDKLILAPMAGICDLPFRLLCKEQGCDILYTEMVSAKGMHYNNKNTAPLIAYDAKEHPIGVQIFGSEPDIMAEQAKKLVDLGYDFIDVNMGCPVPKIVNNKEGSALMKNPALVGEIIEALSKACSIPVTVKIRAGFNKDNINAPEIAYIAQESGASAVAVHGRTREEYYQGTADWSVIRAVKEKVAIPVIGNGDVKSGEDVLRKKKETGCDSVMIGRAAKGNPWIFKEIKHYLETGEALQRPELDEIKQMILRQTKMMIEFKGDYTGIHEMRKHVAWYTQGLKNSSKLRALINQVESYDELCGLLSQI